ncbi:MAG: hypothetical protein HKN89_04695 [Eudoraea sp.]|nr:hypothetical protein [Eudoraea sp.]
MDDYFSENKTEGVTVSLYENHFNDSGNNFTHSVVFTGSLDAIGNMYGGGENTKWELFLTRTGMFTKGVSSAMGRTIASYGDASTPHPIQKYFLLDVEDGSAYSAAYEKYNSEHNPEGRIAALGNISSGHAPDGANMWMVNSFKDFKSAMAGVGGLRNEANREAHSKAWSEYRDTRGEVRLVRSGLRILLGQW